MSSDATINFALLAIGAGCVFAAIRQADWKHPILIGGLIAVGAVCGLVAFFPLLDFSGLAFEPLKLAPKLPQGDTAETDYISIIVAIISFASAIIIAYLRNFRGRNTEHGQIFADATSIASVALLSILLYFLVTDPTVSLLRLVTENAVLFAWVLVSAILSIVGSIVRSIL